MPPLPTARMSSSSPLLSQTPPPQPPSTPSPSLTPSPPRRAYKWSRTHAPTPAWRARLRQTLHSLKTSRDAAHAARRREVLKSLQEEGNVSDGDIEALLHELEELQKEEEEALVRQFEMLHTDDTPANLAERDFEGRGLPCPVCGDGVMGVCNGVVVCKCGVRVGGEGVTEEFVRARLEDVYNRHWRCDGLRFETRCIGVGEGGRFLWCVCGCGEEEIVV